MFRKLRILFFLSLTFFLLCVSITFVSLTYGGGNSAIITVPEDTPSINAAVAMAPKCGIVKIKRGTYTENVYINKSITLLGENDPTILAPLIVAYTQNVTIKGIGFIIDPPGTEPAITATNMSRLTLENLNIKATGIMLINSAEISVKNCNFTGNPGPSISVRGEASKNISVEWCIFNQTFAALSIQQATKVTFKYNTVSAAGSSVKLLSECQNATIYLNNFLDGEAEDYGFNNKWCNETLKLGNYWGWQNHEKDKNEDGVIDEPKIISGTATSEDKYPLAKPFEEYLNSQNKPSNITTYMIAAIASAAAIIAITAFHLKRRRKIEQK